MVQLPLWRSETQKDALEAALLFHRFVADNNNIGFLTYFEEAAREALLPKVEKSFRAFTNHDLADALLFDKFTQLRNDLFALELKKLPV